MDRVVVLGAGFAGLELATVLSEELGEEAGVTLIDSSDAFVFGYSKLDVLFGRATLEEVRLPYEEVVKPGVRFRREKISAIDPETRRVTTDAGAYEGEFLVVALGAAYDVAATPGLAEVGTEFYSVSGAERVRSAVAEFTHGHAVVGVCGAPFKCPPAPSEAALLLHDELSRRGVRGACEISLVMPFASPVPPAPDASAALLEAFHAREIRFVGGSRLRALDPARNVVVLEDGAELPYDLFLGVPKHRAPRVVLESGLAEGDFVPVDPPTLETRFPRVYAVGDVADARVPKAGVLAERAARVVAGAILAHVRGEQAEERYDGRGSCFVEFGSGTVGRVDVDFLSGPKPTGTLHGPSRELAAEKEAFGAHRRARWFGR